MQSGYCMRAEVQKALVEGKPANLLQLKQLATAIPGVDIVFTAANGADCLRQLLQVKKEPDIIITDLLMPEIDGTSLACLLHYARPKMPVIIVSALLSEYEIAELMDMGVKGFLAKANLSAEIIAKAIENVSEGAVFIDETMFDKEKAFAEIKRIQLLPRDVKTIQSFTKKELCFLQLLVTLDDYQQIARAMNLSVKTVHYYAEQLREKTNSRNKMGLTLYALKNRLVKIYKAYVSYTFSGIPFLLVTT
ncbi:MAG: response regulator transcription factor [Hydrotalea sp. AMD]|nr:response regulator transcription factor [Hydrotalea lipotrueae]RWZ85677.1 MAG: response regulator transcription factor [Hydrotalea sp. AMD]